MIAELCKHNGNALDIRSNGPMTVHADRTRVHQVLLNLCSNAAKFTDAGTVSLVLSTEGENAIVDVIDTGIGMKPEQVDKLFGLFAQVHTTGHDKFGGTGLGLALSRSLCRMMDGDITVTSEPGKGSRFRVTLPMAADVGARSTAK